MIPAEGLCSRRLLEERDFELGFERAPGLSSAASVRVGIGGGSGHGDGVHLPPGMRRRLQMVKVGLMVPDDVDYSVGIFQPSDFIHVFQTPLLALGH